MTRNLKTIDLFCGSGGLSCGLSMAGFETLIGVDNNSATVETFQKNHNGSSAIVGDIENITEDQICQKIGSPNIDIIVGGPPCQGLSLSGPRKYDDPRNKLFLSFVRITNEIKPNAFILENVPGLVSLFKGKIKDTIIEEFENIGYNVSFKVLNAADYGVPQLRKRVFFVGLKNQERKFIFPEPTHFETTALLKNEKYITCKEAISDLPSLDSDYMGCEKQNYSTRPENDYQMFMRKDSKFVFNHIGTKHTEKVRKIINMVPDGGNYKNLPEEYKKTRNFHVAWTRFSSKKPASTIDTGHRHHFHYKYNRVPTVRECARLQSFPDNFIFYGNKGQQYSQVGNAVPPLLAKAIGMELSKWL